jgi:hypothetical protein
MALEGFVGGHKRFQVLFLSTRINLRVFFVWFIPCLFHPEKEQCILAFHPHCKYHIYLVHQYIVHVNFYNFYFY